MPSRRTNKFPWKWAWPRSRDPTIFGSTVGYPSDSLASCRNPRLPCMVYSHAAAVGDDWVNLPVEKLLLPSRNLSTQCYFSPKPAVKNTTWSCVWEPDAGKINEQLHLTLKFGVKLSFSLFLSRLAIPIKNKLRHKIAKMFQYLTVSSYIRNLPCDCHTKNTIPSSIHAKQTDYVQAY